MLNPVLMRLLQASGNNVPIEMLMQKQTDPVVPSQQWPQARDPLTPGVNTGSQWGTPPPPPPPAPQSSPYGPPRQHVVDYRDDMAMREAMPSVARNSAMAGHPSFAPRPQAPPVAPPSPKEEQGYFQKLLNDPTRMALLRYGTGVLGGQQPGAAMDSAMAMMKGPDDYILSPGQGRFSGRTNKKIAGLPGIASERGMYEAADGFKYWKDKPTERVNPKAKMKPPKPGAEKEYRETLAEMEQIRTDGLNAGQSIESIEKGFRYRHLAKRAKRLYHITPPAQTNLNIKHVPPGQVEKINELRGLGTSLDLVESHFGENFSNLKEAVGKWQNIKQTAAEWFGQAGYDTQEIRRLSEDLVDQLARLRTGAVINADEETRFKRLIPNPTDEMPSYLNKFQGFREQLDALVKSRIQTAEDFGYAAPGASAKHNKKVKEFTYNPSTGKIEPK